MQSLLLLVIPLSILLLTHQVRSQEYIHFQNISANQAVEDAFFRKDNVPWPWGLEIDFPWRDAQGTYSIDLNGQLINISLRVIQPLSSGSGGEMTSSASFLSIQLIDVGSCKTIGVGRGFQTGNLIRAQFVNQFDNQTYLISLHTFDGKFAKLAGMTEENSERVMVASIGLLQRFPSPDPRKMFNSAMTRISRDPNLCSGSPTTP